VARNIGREQDWRKLEEIPPASPWTRRLAWAVPALILAMIAGGFFFAGREVGTQMVFWWAGITALAAAAGGLIMLAHPLTILAAALAAPFTSIHPFFAAGWVAGITEATLRKPQVKDFLNLRDDLLTLRGFFRNKIVRIFMTVALVNVTTSAGTLVAIPVMMRLLGS
jgi:pheromone shutdown protein TraB